MRNVSDLIHDVDMKLFWQTVDALDEVIDGKEYKRLIREYFHPDGKSKRTKVSLSTDRQLQDWNDINGFVTRIVGRRMPIQQLRNRKAQIKIEIQERKEANRARHQLARGGRSIEKS